MHRNVPSEPNLLQLRSTLAESQRLSPHGSLQCHDPRGSLNTQAYTVCRTAGGIGSAYATGNVAHITAVAVLRTLLPAAIQKHKVLLRSMLTRCELEARVTLSNVQADLDLNLNAPASTSRLWSTRFQSRQDNLRGLVAYPWVKVLRNDCRGHQGSNEK